MRNKESRIIRVLVGIACPLLTFVAFWWTAAAFHLLVLPLPTSAIVTAAALGLGLGGLLDVVFLGRWVRSFYAANLWLIVAVYFGLFVVMLGLFMGVPVGTVALGIAAGAYIGRREHYHQTDEAQATPAVRKAAIFAASATTAAALPIGILALRSEQQVLDWIEDSLRLGRNCLRGGGGWVLVGSLCLLLFVMQYWCARTAGRLAFGIGTRRLSPNS